MVAQAERNECEERLFEQAALTFDPTFRVYNTGLPADGRGGLWRNAYLGKPVGPIVRDILAQCPQFFHMASESIYPVWNGAEWNGDNVTVDTLCAMIWCASDHVNDKITVSQEWLDFLQDHHGFTDTQIKTIRNRGRALDF